MEVRVEAMKADKERMWTEKTVEDRNLGGSLQVRDVQKHKSVQLMKPGVFSGRQYC